MRQNVRAYSSTPEDRFLDLPHSTIGADGRTAGAGQGEGGLVTRNNPESSCNALILLHTPLGSASADGRTGTLPGGAIIGEQMTVGGTICAKPGELTNWPSSQLQLTSPCKCKSHLSAARGRRLALCCASADGAARADHRITPMG